MNSKQRLTKSIGFVLLCALLFHSCTDDDNSISNPQNQDPDPTAFAQNFFGNDITRTFLGTVVDINNNPIENVTIRIGSSTAMTDTNGVFIINDAPVNKRFGYVKAEKVGYIHASRSVVPSEGTNKVRIMMLPETSAGTTSSGAQETISLQNGASVALEGDYIKPDGSSYSGSVNVIMHHLDPVDDNIRDQMPGMLYAANAQNEERMLQTFGMLAVELRGDNGEDLNLAENSTAEITVPLDPSLMANAPSSIPLWYFDETHGYWIEDGVATLVGNAYVGTVSHFSFWNCDIPTEYVDFCVTVNDSEGNPLTNIQVTLTSVNYGTGYGYTNENGETCGIIPSGETLELNAYNYDLCGQSSIYSDTIGPFDVDSSITITVTTDDSNIISETVTGMFNDCDGNPVTDGYISLNYGNQYLTNIVEDGNFEFNLIRCQTDDTFMIRGSDYVNLQTTDSISYTFTTPLTNIGSISACNAVDEFITYQVDNNDDVSYFFNVSGGQDGDVFIASYYSENQSTFFELYISNFNGAGTYDMNTLISFYDANNNGTTLETEFSGTCNVNSFGDVGDYIDINFSGVLEELGEQMSINGTLHVIRDF
nr:hypothetical protein [uncultured Psychroserpens sp.]